MSALDASRYYLALVLVISVPGAVLFWFPIHPFAAFWRRVGALPAYLTGFGAMLVAGVALFRLRGPLLAVDFGPSRMTAAAGLLLWVFAGVLRHLWRRQLKLSVLVGLPELAPDRHPPMLLTDGIYAHVRHPRYLEFSLGATGAALLSNYAAGYAAVVVTIAGLALLVPFEERELEGRFGEAYRDYRRRVPAFIPSLRRRRRA